MKKDSMDPKILLQAAIEELDLFTQSAVGLKLGKDGHLVASKETLLEKVVGLARCFIGPIFSEQMRQNQAKKLDKLKQAILNARDIIQSHSALILKFKEGDDSQRKLADYAFSAIQRYNAIICNGSSAKTTKYDTYHYERHHLLLDQEIKNRPIELPHTLSVKFDSYPDTHPAHRLFKEFKEAFPVLQAVKKIPVTHCPTHKKKLQFMVDTFHMKAIRMMQTHLSQHNTLAEIVSLVKGTSIEIDDETTLDLIKMQQHFEIGPGYFILISGCFKKNITDSQLLAYPLLDSFQLNFQLIHSGFPYPSQYTGWALADKWVEAHPLRLDHLPLFQKISLQKKQLAQKLLFNQAFIQKAHRHASYKREIFDQNRDIFLDFFRQLQKTLITHFSEEDERIFEAFFLEISQAPSSFDLLVQSQQQLQELFIRKPIEALEEEWLGTAPTPLRNGSAQDKFFNACQRLEHHRKEAQEKLDVTDPCQAYILMLGNILGSAFQTIGLQYQSEKMGFSPPLLNDFERRLQRCAFQHQLSFLDECENRLGVSSDQIKNDLLQAWNCDLKILQKFSDEIDHPLSLAIIEELENYFNLQCYSFNP